MEASARISMWLAVACVLACGDTSKGAPERASTEPPTPLAVPIPDRLVPMPIPADNPLTVQGVELGRYLFYDVILSGDNNLSCASCHVQEHSFTDGKKVSVGAGGASGTRNSMPLINLAWHTSFFWDGRAATLEEAVLSPIQSPIELNQPLGALEAELRARPEYVQRFRRAFPGELPTANNVAKALSQFLRTIVSFDSLMDGDYDNMSPQLVHGHRVLRELPLGIKHDGEDLCDRCHRHAYGLKEPKGMGLFIDDAFRNNGIAESKDRGREAVTGKSSDRGLFKVPTIRNLRFTAPYMHDGRYATLREVVVNLNSHIQASPTLDPVLMHKGKPMRMGLSDDDIDAAVAVLLVFSGPDVTTNPAYSDPFAKP